MRENVALPKQQVRIYQAALIVPPLTDEEQDFVIQTISSFYEQ